MTKVKAIPVEGQFVYRYVQVNYAPPIDEFETPMGKGTTDIYLQKFEVLSKTPKGLWMDGPEGKKFINMEARRKYACLTEEDALTSFIARKERHIDILEAQAESAKKALYIAKKKAGLLDKTEFYDIIRYD